jgi:hypothetical protein
MSRDLESESPEHGPQQDLADRIAPTLGRGGSSGDNDPAALPDFDLSELRSRIDRAAEDAPAATTFFERLQQESVHAVASLQKNGRWNGISYEFAGVRVKGSELGRAYTATGLQRKKGVGYDPTRDAAQLRDLAPPPSSLERNPGPRQQPEREPRSLPIDARQERVLWDAGRFRTLAISDLTREHYAGDHARLQQDLKYLARLGFIERHTISLASNRTLSLITLTRTGKKLLRASASPETRHPQGIYSGVVKSRELAHDAAIYRMFLAEFQRIEREGGHVQRVLLDYELKKRAYTPLAKAQNLPPLEYAERREEIANENRLPVVDGHIVLPDLRIEYETADGEMRHIDLELATRNYRGAHIRVKAAAGFKVYADTNSGPLRAALDEHDLVAELLRM